MYMKKRIVALMLGTLVALSTVGSTFTFASSVLDTQQNIVSEQTQEFTGSEQVDGSVESNSEQEVEGSDTGEELDPNIESSESSSESFNEESNIVNTESTSEEASKYSESDLSSHSEVLNSIRESIQNANLDLSVKGSSDEEDKKCDEVFNSYGVKSGPSFFSADEYNSVPEIGSKHQVGSLTTDYGVGLWQRTAIDVVDYWDGYAYGWDIVDEWDRGVIGATFPNSPSGGTPMWCLEPGRNFTRTNRLIGNALNFLSQDEITCLGLIDKYVDDNMSERFIKPGGFPNQENGLWSAKYGMKQLAFWTFLETTRPSFPNGPFTNHNGVKKTVHNAPVMFEANAQFEGGGYWFLNEAVKYALNNRANYKGYGKVAYNTAIQNQLVGLFMVQEVEKPKAGLEVVKTSANSAITNNNGNYSLAGAIYGVYRDYACSNEVGRITTDSSGRGRLNGLELGTYYVKELKASPGYGLDTNIHTINVTK